MYLRTPAKINLGLHVVAKRADGYHDLETAFYPIPLCDVVEIEPAYDDDTPCSLQTDGISIDGAASDNIVVKVYMAMRSEFHLPPVRINLRKAIPTGAGLGGGSSDAAATMHLLNALFQLGLSHQSMEERLAAFGADCPFFVKAKPVLATGIGNVFSPINLDLVRYWLMLVKPDIHVNTASAYSRVVPRKGESDIAEVLSRPVSEWRDVLRNDFETSVFAVEPSIGAIKQTLYDLGADYASMSGSGSAVFALFRQEPPDAVAAFSDCFYFKHQLPTVRFSHHTIDTNDR